MVVLDAVPAQIGLHLGDVPLQAEGRQGLQALCLLYVPVLVSVEVVEGLGQFPDIIAVIAVLGKGHLLLPQQELEVAGLNGHGEFVNLIAGVVDIELFPGVAAVPAENVGQGVSQHPAPGISHVHGTGGVGGDKLHHHLLAPALVTLSVEGTFGLNLRQHIPIPFGAQPEIQKARAGDLHRGEEAVCQVHVVHHRLGDGPGGHFHGLGAGHGEGGGVVPVLGVFGNFHRPLYFHPGGEDPRGGGGGVGLGGQLADLVLCVLN